MVQTGEQDRRKGIIERCGWIEAALRLPRRRRRVGRKVKAARRLAADGRPDRPILREPFRELVDCASAAVLELQLDLAHRHRAIARFQNAVVERNLDRAGRQVNDALVPVDVGGEHRLKRRRPRSERSLAGMKGSASATSGAMDREIASHSPRRSGLPSNSVSNL